MHQRYSDWSMPHVAVQLQATCLALHVPLVGVPKYWLHVKQAQLLFE